MNNKSDFLNLVADRYSVRNFTSEPIKQEDLDLILRAGHLAPTACNLQPQRILVINNEEGIEKLKKCTKCHFDAPTAMIIGYSKEEAWKRKYDGKDSGEIDASIVTTHMMLAAHDIGVGTTWVMYYIPEAVQTEFQIPENIEVIAILVMGYPAEDAKPYPSHSEFRPREEVVFYNKF